MSSLTTRIVLFLVLIAASKATFKNDCEEKLLEGRQIIENVADVIAAEEMDRRSTAFYDKYGKILGMLEAREPLELDDTTASPTPPLCPAPNGTMFTKKPTHPPPIPTTTTVATTVTADSTSAGPTTTEYETTSQTQTDTQTPTNTPTSTQTTSTTPKPTTTIPPFREKREIPGVPFRPPTLYVPDEGQDPYFQHFNTLYNYMSSPAEVCDGPQFTDLNSITEHQLYGFFSTMATTQPGPFCSLCDRFVSFVSDRLFTPSRSLNSEDEYAMKELIYAQVPSAKAICTSMAPGCYEEYDKKTRNISEAIVCVECSACMSITNVIQHRFLLQPAAVEWFYEFLRGNLFHNLCAEMCPTFTSKNYTLFPNGFSYDGCQNYFAKEYKQIIRIATVLTRPERLCSLELGWCELNEQPNMIHCLRELCVEYFNNTPQAQYICSIIPDAAPAADAFLNIQKSKIYKQRKDYHRSYQQDMDSTVRHEEL